MVNNHFAVDSLLSVQADQDLVACVRSCLYVFCEASRTIISNHKIDYWLVGLDNPLHGFRQHGLLTIWIIVKYLDIPFGVGLLLVAMREWYLERLQRKLLFW
jgi:hypothetical protein